jgi:formylglycine-generating enzyme required for sulfatase activity
MSDDLRRKLEELEAKLASLETVRQAIGEQAYQTGRANIEAQITHLKHIQTDGGAVIGGNVSTTNGDVVGRDQTKIDAQAGATVIYVQSGGRVVIGEEKVEMPAVQRSSDLGRYLEHLIAQNRYLELQGIRSGGRLVSVELERIYITLHTIQRGRAVNSDEETEWLQSQAALAPGETRRLDRPESIDANETRVEQVLARHRHLVVLGDPGSGKTTLLRYLALIFSRDKAEGCCLVQERLGVAESGSLPLLLPLRKLGAFLQSRRPVEDGLDGHALLLQYLLESLRSERIELSNDFFDEYLKSGRSVILLDGLDEIADVGLRRRVSRLVQSFARAYPHSRFVITSRIVGYVETVRLEDDFVAATVRDFSPEDICTFLTRWHQAVMIGQMGPGESAIHAAADQTRQLVEAIQANPRIQDLAINPLMLTVIALVHRDRVKLPDRRAELYAEAVDVLLGKRDEARGIKEMPILEDRPFDTGDKRLLLQRIALFMHENGRKEIELEQLQRLLREQFSSMCSGAGAVRRAAARFLSSITERAGLLLARGEGTFGFSHLTFQEYLAAAAVADREDYLTFSVDHAGDEWWREVLLLEAGYLSLQGRERVTRLVQAIANSKRETQPYHNLVLAAECLRDVGEARLEGNTAGEIRTRMAEALRSPRVSDWGKELLSGFRKGGSVRARIERRADVANAFGRIGGASYWSGPYGEPEWVDIPAGSFWMGSERGGGDEKPLHQVTLPRYQMARVPVTNAQYTIFIRETGHRPPEAWAGDRPPRGKDLHPVVNVSWSDAQDYTTWLSLATGKRVQLPSEAEWEKAARGSQDQREFPWGERFEAVRCNTRELEIVGTTPVGIFLEGASPYGVLDISGNVWEWTRSAYQPYPYDPNDGREDLMKDINRVLRGGSWYSYERYARCAYRYWSYPYYGNNHIGFRVVVLPSSTLNSESSGTL